MPFIGNQPALAYTSFAKQDFTTSATTNYVLDQAVTNANEIALFINFVRQEPTTAYTASGTALTLTSATTAGDDMYCIFLGKALQTVNPPAGSVGSSQINYPLTTFSSTGIDDNATSTAVTIDSSQNVGIKTTTPATELDISSGATTGGTKRYITLTSLNNSSSEVAYADVGTTFNQNSAGNESGGMDFRCAHNGSLANRYSFGGGAGDIHTWYTDTGTERMRMNNVGKIALATTTVRDSAPLTVYGNGVCQIVCEASSASNGFSAIHFRNPNGIVGNIATNISSVSYNTTSDYRLKNNISDVLNAIDRVKQLKPIRFSFIAEPDKTVDGFLAHEIQDVVPEAVTGTKDATETYIDDEGNEQTRPVYQGIDQAKLVPLLTAGLQEAIAKIETLEARITALENA